METNDAIAPARPRPRTAADLVVFGANGPTGRLLTARALAEGHHVTAFTRHPESFPLDHDELDVAAGDVFDRDAVDRAVAGRDVVLSTLGVPFGRQPISVYSEGMANIVAAMRAGGVRRLVCVTSSTMDPHPDQDGGVVFRRMVQPFVVDVLGRTLYEDMRRMEAVVRDSSLDWTIVRPSGLFGHPEVTDYLVAEDHLPGRFTSRTDLADCLLRQAADETFVGHAIAVSTVAVRPSIVQLIWREGIRKQA